MTWFRSIFPPLSVVLVAGLWAAPAQAQGVEPGNQVQTLVNELRAELDRAEKDRLADPWFLRDLRQILDRYDFPWQVRILHDDFSGQGPGPDAPWRVTAGEFLIDWRHGLRTVIKPPRQTQSQQQSDPTAALIGALLQQALTGEQGGQQTTSQEPTYAAMIAPARISNAFAIEIELSSRPVDGVSTGRLEFGPYQGEGANAGYRLVYSPGAPAGSPSLELLRVSSRGTTSTLEFYDQPLSLQDGQPHTLTWTRDRAGMMVVKLDGQVLMETTDRSYRDPFDGLAVVNSGGDYAFRRVTIDGTG
ncbi:MAG: hypothetical protein V3R30_03480 [Kiloniellales bacterium]